MRKVYARDSRVEEIDPIEARVFVEKYHRQGYSTPGRNLFAYGIFLDKELLGVAIFCNPRTSAKQREYSTELFRLCFLDDVRVIGGASKLIKKALREHSVYDLFTYQDTAGEASDVYKHAGMKLAKKARKKKILVANGLSASTATNNRRDWFSLEQASRLGPDALIGTSLGEVFDSSGRRKSNIDLFIDHCGYHLEEVPGDRVFDWFNPNVSFYVYRLTSTKDKGYYIGRRVLHSASITEEDCLNDPYFGSGGRKLREWKESVGTESLQKEILGIYSTWRDAIQAEADFIGESFRTDPNCKNTIAGGATIGRTGYSKGICSVHGKTTFRGQYCARCTSENSIEEKICEIHGLGKFLKDKCFRCMAASLLSIKDCSRHGATLHQNEKCCTCTAEASVAMRECTHHGAVKHVGGVCATCRKESFTRVKTCEIHGETSFQGRFCSKCLSASTHKIRECAIHGKSLHKGSSCATCISDRSKSMKHCEIHGETLHKGTTCYRCSSKKALHTKECEIHGKTLFQGENCCRCQSLSIVTVFFCKIHGETKAVGGKCKKCSTGKLYTKQTCEFHGESGFRKGKCIKCTVKTTYHKGNCSIHGEATFNADKCTKCLANSRISFRECPHHGTTKHQGVVCGKCSANSSISLKNCEKHGFVKHQKDNCFSCRAEARESKRRDSKDNKNG